METSSEPQQTPSEALDPSSRELRQVHTCEHVKRDGTRCTRYVATQFLSLYPSDPPQWLCPAHRPRASKPDAQTVTPGAAEPLPKPPVTHLRKPSDSVKLSSWAAIQGALGRLSPQQGQQIVAACREFRSSYALAEKVATVSRLLDTTVQMLDAQAAGDDDTARRLRAEGSALLTTLGKRQ